MKLVKISAVILTALLLASCAKGNSPAQKKANARKAAANVEQQIYKEHQWSKGDFNQSYARMTCFGNNTYLFFISTGGGVCVLKERGNTSYLRFATAGAGVGIGLKQVGYTLLFRDRATLTRFKTDKFDVSGGAEASAKYEDNGGQASATQSADFNGIKTYQVNTMGAALQATIQGVNYWTTDFSSDVM
ncbi:hypothetical protein L0B53_00495 [Vibrio sp. SS-MA-C1-2]|uniref:hypothetical protein n=1 Tax=Vibrio sp. SS-MA-C1-2 TaxID=2908646 RepID=UPI001F25A9AB|nr:hypothetical protein [Vibrio sp. SS-MA-C1-2]UJF17291.1 hypothetical protein L0B53_00495 [Vibrio sp. SS-MA-C1-2]